MIRLSDRAARRAVWSVVVLSLISGSLGLTLQALTGRITFNLGLPFAFGLAMFAATWAIIGAVIVTKQPRHPVGWLMVAMVVFVGPQLLAFGLLAYSLETGSAFPVTDLALIGLAWTGQPFFFLGLTLLLMMYPNGRLLSRRWAIVGWLGLIAVTGYLLVVPLQPVVVDPGIGMHSPLAVPPHRWEPLQRLLDFFIGLSVAGLLAAAASLIIRLRNSTGLERQQLKWFVYPAILVILAFSAVANVSSDELSKLDFLLVGLAMASALGMAVALAFAILRYRLYNIDLIVNRSLVYGTLTVTLAAVYFVSVIVLQNSIRLTIGQESPIAIVASTLIVGALFQPLRSRLQNLINRRFYRTRYDLGRTLDRFGSALTETIDMEAQVDLLLGTVEEAIQPTHVSLWMRSRAQPS